MKFHNLLKEIEKDKMSQLHSAEKEVVDFLIALISITSSKSILEIGTHLGYTSFGILLNLRHIRITSVDFTENYKPYLIKLPKTARNRITLVHLPAGIFYSKMRRRCRFDMVFIDADHSYLATFRDFIHTFPYADNGIFVFHDSLNPYFPGVRNLIKLLRFSNFLALGFFCDIFSIETPHNFKSNLRPPSGITVIKIKGNSIVKRIIYYLLKLVYAISFLLIARINIGNKFKFFGNDNSF